MWVVVDSGLASMSELEKDWTLDDYVEACEYLETKAAAQKEASDKAQAQARGRGGL